MLNRRPRPRSSKREVSGSAECWPHRYEFARTPARAPRNIKVGATAKDAGPFASASGAATRTTQRTSIVFRMAAPVGCFRRRQSRYSRKAATSSSASWDRRPGSFSRRIQQRAYQFGIAGELPVFTRHLRGLSTIAPVPAWHSPPPLLTPAGTGSRLATRSRNAASVPVQTESDIRDYDRPMIRPVAVSRSTS